MTALLGVCFTLGVAFALVVRSSATGRFVVVAFSLLVFFFASVACVSPQLTRSCRMLPQKARERGWPLGPVDRGFDKLADMIGGGSSSPAASKTTPTSSSGGRWDGRAGGSSAASHRGRRDGGGGGSSSKEYGGKGGIDDDTAGMLYPGGKQVRLPVLRVTGAQHCCAPAKADFSPSLLPKVSLLLSVYRSLHPLTAEPPP